MANHSREDRYLELSQKHHETGEEIVELEQVLEDLEEKMEDIREAGPLNRRYIARCMEI